MTTFKQPSLELGVRGGYYPLAFLGGELEGMVAVAEGNTGDGASVLAARAHVVLQSPFWSVVPFVLGGVGYWNVRNDVSGNDADPREPHRTQGRRAPRAAHDQRQRGRSTEEPSHRVPRPSVTRGLTGAPHHGAPAGRQISRMRRATNIASLDDQKI